MILSRFVFLASKKPLNVELLCITTTYYLIRRFYVCAIICKRYIMKKTKNPSVCDSLTTIQLNTY